MSDKSIVSAGTVLAVISVGLLLFVAAGGGGNSATPESSPMGELEQRVAKMEDQVGASGERAEGLEASLANKAEQSELDKLKADLPADLAEQFGQLRGRIDSLETTKADRSALEELQDEVEGLKELLVETRATLQQVSDNQLELRRLIDLHERMLDEISYESADGRLPKIEANMEVGGFGEEMQRVVNSSIGTQSSLYITNKTGVTQQVLVNELGSWRDVLPGETIGPIEVPTGTVTTRLPGQEMVNWAIGAPSYEQRIAIIDHAGVVTYYDP